jgi:protein-tyrosine phosphatase
VTRILCVCLGNICRSPTAEAVLRHKGGDRVSVDSAGTGDWHVGNQPYPPAILAAEQRGYDLGGLKARKVTAQDFGAFDLILAMDPQNREDLEAIRPADNKIPVRLIMGFAPQLGATDVPDPYFTGDFEHALDLIEAASDALLQTLD